MGIDRFGNSHAPNLSYTRGDILRSAMTKLRRRCHSGGLKS